ncbi:RsmB/NOP family class I SAM-dependent RNA methyltransferase [Lamprobacter modestohalophilus]|uniref:RsmB/NOP family class I SAM-dependent RNA methyltransferase n=1 Tax=Lamprobacter modestohalophilus TaxID=1064514 RepID=UPI002ADEC9C4|nr:RsmB/NOP family class I SAM-dependent RNA methyltransferase [Lamprobacter modestohalophilus]MEA1049390.1 RsmB/NOP family class I SAM-dependent RNA methyltransferase [Lamprobacter modestohalophilus]
MIPPSTASADLEAALGRYRCLFDQQVEGWDAFISTLMRPLPTWIWAHPLRIEGQQLRALIAEEGVSAEPVPWLNPWWSSIAARVAAPGAGLTADGSAFGSDAPVAVGKGSEFGASGAALPIALRLPPGFKAGQRWWYCAGLAHAQEAVSQLPVMLLDVRPGQRVLDLCAAPGGKTAQLAFALGNRGTLLANDFAAERIAALQGNLDRLGVLNCSTTRCDGGNYPVGAGAFDRILVDAPCSSEGTLRRNPSLLQRSSQGSGQGSGERVRAHAGIGPERSQRMAGRQRALLRKAVQLCRPGGRIVYSTCTFAPEENELIVAEILDEQNGNLELLPCELPGLVAAAGVTQWQGRQLDSSLSRCLRIWPHANDTGGFFVAVLQKAAQAPSLDAPNPARLQLEPDDDGWLQGLGEHYGLSTAALAGRCFHRQTRRGLHLMAADHLPPAAPSLQGSGLFAYRTNTRPPKLTTGAALLLGAAASRQTLELSTEQRDRYLRRELWRPSPEQMVDCSPGQVLVRYRGFTLGVSVLHRSGDLESLFPSRWSGCSAGA